MTCPIITQTKELNWDAQNECIKTSTSKSHPELVLGSHRGKGEGN